MVPGSSSKAAPDARVHQPTRRQPCTPTADDCPTSSVSPAITDITTEPDTPFGRQQETSLQTPTKRRWSQVPHDRFQGQTGARLSTDCERANALLDASPSTNLKRSSRTAPRLRRQPEAAAQARALRRRRSDSQIGAARACVLVKSTLSLRLRLCGLRARWRSTTDREQRRGALGAVALPAGPTIREGDLLRVGDRDLFAADAPALGPGSITCPFDSSILRA
jgi:hypothetical protein